MHAILAVLVAGSAMVYEAKVTTFGCNSLAEVTQLQRIRSDKDSFHKRLYQQLVLGECIAIAQGQVVDASLVDTSPMVLRVGAAVNPPGFIAPKDDFKLKADDAKQQPPEPGAAAK
jgi:hypothetical protein